jgi:hypothetical protein
LDRILKVKAPGARGENLIMTFNWIARIAAISIFMFATASQTASASQPGAAQPGSDRKAGADQVRAAKTDGGDVVTAGRNVHVDDKVVGDLAAAGADVTVEAPVDGYVMSAGRNVTLAAPIGNDLWAAGESVNVDTEVGNNARVAGRTVHLHPGARIGGDARLAGNTVTSEGRIDRDLYIGAATARIGGAVGGDVEASAARVTLLPGAVVRGDVVVRGASPPEISPDAQVLGQVRYEEERQSGGWFAWPGFWLVCFAALLILGLAAASLWPGWPTRVSRTMRARTMASILSGVLVVVSIPLLLGVLAVSIVGIPLAVVLFALYLLILLLSAVFVSYRIGEWLFDRMHRTHASFWARLVLGVFVVSLGVSLPAVGWVVALAVLVAGAGALVLEQREQRASAWLG